VYVGYYARCSWLGLSELALALCCTFSLLQATLTIGSKEHLFVGNPVAKQTLLRLTTSEDDNGGVVANITHKLHQRVSAAGTSERQLTSTLTDDAVYAVSHGFKMSILLMWMAKHSCCCCCSCFIAAKHCALADIMARNCCHGSQQDACAAMLYLSTIVKHMQRVDSLSAMPLLPCRKSCTPVTSVPSCERQRQTRPAPALRRRCCWTSQWPCSRQAVRSQRFALNRPQQCLQERLQQQRRVSQYLTWHRRTHHRQQNAYSQPYTGPVRICSDKMAAYYHLPTVYVLLAACALASLLPSLQVAEVLATTAA
jgi:hypothetical protein